MAFKKWNTNSRSIPPAKKDYLFQMFCCCQEFLGWNNPKSRVQQFTFQPDLPEDSLLMVNNHVMQDNQGMNLLPETFICCNYSKNHLITKERMGAHFTRLDLK